MSFQNNFILFRTMVMYEWYMAYVRIVHGYYTKLKKAPINAFFCGFYGDFRS